MSLLRAYGWELRKLVRQKRTFAGLLAAVLYALAFVIALSVKKHAGIPPDIPLAKQVTKTAVVLPLALLAFATFFGAPVISSLVAGDIVASEDSNNTLKTILTRSPAAARSTARKHRRGDLRRRPDRDAARRLGCRLNTIAWGLHGVQLLDGRPSAARMRLPSSSPRMPRTSCRSRCS